MFHQFNYRKTVSVGPEHQQVTGSIGAVGLTSVTGKKQTDQRAVNRRQFENRHQFQNIHENGQFKES